MMVEGVTILDKWGRERTPQELKDVYGDIEITPCVSGGSCWRVSAIVEKACLHGGFPPPDGLSADDLIGKLTVGPAMAGIIATEVRINGYVLPEIEVALCGPGNSLAISRTGTGGIVHFAVSESYDPAKGEVGPYAISIRNMPSDRISGLGILAGEQPAHLDVVFSWRDVRQPDEMMSAIADLVRANELLTEGMDLIRVAKRKLEGMNNGR